MKSKTYQLAESLSLALNPFVLLPIVFLIALFATEFETNTIQTRWLGIILLGNILIPLTWIHYLDSRGIVLDDTLKNKKLHRKRLIALLPVSSILMIEIIGMGVTQIYEPLFAVLLSTVAVVAVGGIISFYWKVSAHTIGISTTITLLALLLGTWILWSALIIPFLAWARLKLHRHTPLQLIVGTIVPPVTIILIFNYLSVL